jgi:hypothetical protein
LAEPEVQVALAEVEVAVLAHPEQLVLMVEQVALARPVQLVKPVRPVQPVALVVPAAAVVIHRKYVRNFLHPYSSHSAKAFSLLCHAYPL